MERAKRYEISFGKDKYHLQEEMNSWCEEHIGNGGWIPDPDAAWLIECMFGKTTYSFKHEVDFVLFKLRWQ